MHMQPGVTIGFLHGRIGVIGEVNCFFCFVFFNKNTWRVSVAVVHLLMLADYERKERLESCYSKNLSWILPTLFCRALTKTATPAVPTTNMRF